MSSKTLPISEESLVNLLRTLPEKKLAEVFWKTFVEFDASPLTAREKRAVKKGTEEHKRGETISFSLS